MSMLLSATSESLNISFFSHDFYGLEDSNEMSWEEWLHWYYLYTNNWFECNAFCVAFLLFDLAGLFTHYWMMAGPLHGWANGNLGLLTYTLLSGWMSLFSGSLLVGNPYTMMAPKWQRQTFFLIALMQVLTFNAQLVALVYKYF